MAWQTIDQQFDKDKNTNDRSNYLKDIIAGLSIANNNNPATLLGFGLGRWLSSYLDRGEKRRREEKRNEEWDKRNGTSQPTVVEGHSIPPQSTAAREQPAADQLARETNPGEWVNRQYANPDSFLYDPWTAYQSGAVSLEDSLRSGLMPGLGWRR